VGTKTTIDWLLRRPRVGERGKRRAVRAIESLLVALIVVLLCLVVGEVGVRIAIHAPLFEWRDFRHGRATGTINKVINYDSLLGWRLRPFIVSDGFNTLDYASAPMVDRTLRWNPAACWP
jgi:hypothetical protein